MGSILGLDWQPIKRGTGRPAWDERTKAENALMDQGKAMLEERLTLFLDVLKDPDLEEDEMQRQLQGIADGTEQDIVRINLQLRALNKGHIGYRHGREAVAMSPKMFELKVNEFFTELEKTRKEAQANGAV